MDDRDLEDTRDPDPELFDEDAMWDEIAERLTENQWEFIQDEIGKLERKVEHWKNQFNSLKGE